MVWGGVGVEVVFVLVRLLVIGSEVMGVSNTEFSRYGRSKMPIGI